jgi:hypothetical protein
MDVESSSWFTVNGDSSVQMAGASDTAADVAPVARRGGGAVGMIVEGSRRCPCLGRSVPFSRVRLATVILGMRASYKRMAAGGQLPRSLGLPPITAREKGEEQTWSFNRS